MRYNKNFENVIEFLEINRYGFYPPTNTNKEMYDYFKEKGINFTYSKTGSGFYKFELVKGD